MIGCARFDPLLACAAGRSRQEGDRAMTRFVSNRLLRAAAVVVVSCAVFAAASANAEKRPEGEPVKWDQARVTQLANELNAAVNDAVHAVRKSPTQQQIGQRQSWYDMREALRLLENTTGHLQTELQKGASQEETLSTFKRIETLRRDAEEIGRKSALPEPVMAALVKAGAIHNQMRPYYFGKS
jgi:hypothetical protein